jgi:hypothetical protein
MTPFTPACTCQACQALKANRPSQWAWLPHKLLIRGWAGQTDPLEKAFIRAHASWATAKTNPTDAQIASRSKFKARYVQSADANSRSAKPTTERAFHVKHGNPR